MQYVWKCLNRVCKRSVWVLVCMMLFSTMAIGVGAKSDADAYLASNVVDGSYLIFIADAEGTGTVLDRYGRATTVYFYEAFVDGVLVEYFYSIDDVSASPGFYGNVYDTENGWYCLNGYKYADTYEDIKVTGSEEITQIYSNKYISVENGTVDLELTSTTKYASAIDGVEISSLNELKALLAQRGAVDICTVYDDETGVVLYLYVVDTVILDDGVAKEDEVAKEDGVEKGFAGGAGTKEKPYLIETKEQLDNMRNYLSAYFKMTADIEFTAADFAYGGALYDPATGGAGGWVSIGTQNVPFTGMFDGAGHTITGLMQNITATEKVYGGLFGYASGATIKNLGMVDSSISVSTSSSTADAGGIVGYLEDGRIIDCYNTGTVSATDNAGGIVGWTKFGNISRCYNTGAVSVEDLCAGGIVAQASYHYLNGKAYGSSISHCYNTGAVASSHHAGGIAGYAAENGIIDNCYNAGDVSGEARAGGIVADWSNDSELSNCYNAGGISSERAGGIAAESAASRSSVNNCYYLNTCSVGLYDNDSAADTTIKCTAEQLKQQATFSGFAFSTVWQMGDGGSYLFPTLRAVQHVEQAENTVDFAGGNGANYNPYLISGVAHLDNVRKHLDASFKMIADVAFREVDFATDGAFFNGGVGWVSIGTENKPFTGSFDGNGFAVVGLAQDISSASTVYGGLFGYTNGALIQNLDMLDVSISVNETYDDIDVYTGGVVGYAYSSTISNCRNTGVVAVSGGDVFVGGIAGYVKGAVSNCQNASAVTASGSGTYLWVGGVVGVGSASNCRNTSEVKASGFDARAGGIVGDGSARNCCNMGTVTVLDSSYAHAGGIVGAGSADNCYNMGTATTADSRNAYAGGIVGYANYSSTVSNCYNIGAVTGARIGGIVGGRDKNSTVSYCYYIDSCAAGVGGGTDTAVKCTAEQLKSQATFVGFNFVDDWKMSNGGSYPYPTLREVQHISGTEQSVIAVAVTTLPNKTIYEEDETLDLTGGKLTVYYSSGESETVDLMSAVVSGFDAAAVGVQTLSVSYKGFTTTFSVEVCAPIRLSATPNIVNGHIVLFVKADREITTQVLHIALYSEVGQMLDYIIVPTVEPFTTTNVVFDDDAAVKTAKVFLWDSLSTTTPIAEAVEVTIR